MESKRITHQSLWFRVIVVVGVVVVSVSVSVLLLGFFSFNP